MALGSPKLCLKHGLQHLKSPDRNVRLEFSVFPLSKGFALEPCGSPKLVMCFFFSGTTLGHPGHLGHLGQLGHLGHLGYLG